jgi:hypothetical protein
MVHSQPGILEHPSIRGSFLRQRVDVSGKLSPILIDPEETPRHPEIAVFIQQADE